MIRTPFLTSTLLAAAAAFGQTPAFEVASIRPSQAAGPQGMHEMPGREAIKPSPDGVTARGASLRTLVRWAYHVTEAQVTGPDWIGSTRFDLTAKAAGEVPEEQLRLMMQTLLKDRFKMAAHRENKEMQAYLLQVAKGGVKFKESTSTGESDIQPNQSTMSISVQRTGISMLTDMLSAMFRAPVIDQTGLTGKYDITINMAKYIADFSAAGKDAPPDPFAIIMRGIQEELGLKLEPKKMPVDLVVIERAEKVPSAN